MTSSVPSVRTAQASSPSAASAPARPVTFTCSHWPSSAAEVPSAVVVASTTPSTATGSGEQEPGHDPSRVARQAERRSAVTAVARQQHGHEPGQRHHPGQREHERNEAPLWVQRQAGDEPPGGLAEDDDGPDEDDVALGVVRGEVHAQGR
jgi:hypothetical protein